LAGGHSFGCDLAVEDGLRARGPELDDYVLRLDRKLRAGNKGEQELLVLLKAVRLGCGHNRVPVEGCQQSCDCTSSRRKGLGGREKL
jgi:hypothetical protein